MGGYGAPAAAGSEMRGKDDMHMPWGDDWNKSDDELKGECCEMPRRNCYSIIKGKGLACDVGAMRGKDDWHMPWGDAAHWYMGATYGDTRCAVPASLCLHILGSMWTGPQL